MAMGIVSDEDFEKELNRNGSSEIVFPKVPDSLQAPVIKIPGSGNHGEQGRKEGDKNVPDFLRNTIVQDAVENGRASAVDFAASYGISAPSVDAYISGRVSTGNVKGSDKELVDQSRKAKDRIAIRARKRLNLALNHITEDKLADAKLRDIASVAKDMAVIIKQMEPMDSGVEKNTNVQVVLFAPKVMEESAFPRVMAKD